MEQSEHIEEAKPNGTTVASALSGALPEVPQCLSVEHMELYRPALDACVAANENLMAAQERFNGAVKAQQAAVGALTYVMEFLKPKYQMQPGEDLDREGNILRKGA